MNDMTFEQAIAKIERLVETLEKGETSLDESIEIYKEGTELSKFCFDKLTNVEKQIEILTEEKGIFSSKNVDIENKE